MPPAIDLAAIGFDPQDPDFIADPYPVFARMRELGPLLPYGARGVFLLTRFADVNTCLRDRRLGRAYHHKYTDDAFGQSGPDPRFPRFAESERWSLLNIEPPDHTRLRRLITKVFTARSIAGMRSQIEQFAESQLAKAMEKDTFDLISAYAQPFSVTVICRLLGVPAEDGHLLLDWSHAIVKMYEFSTSDAARAGAERAADEFISYVEYLIAARRAEPQDDLVTELVQVSESGDRLTRDEIICTVIVLLNAGHEATVNTLGNGMRALLTHPEEWRRVTSGEVSTDVAVEEMIRWDAPLQLFERWVLEDGVQIAGREFTVGERVSMMFGSANRDPARFPDPDRFDIGRGESTHIGFGGGLHFCIGAPLARLELEISLDKLRSHPGIELAQTPEYQPFFVIRGLKSLTVTGL